MNRENTRRATGARGSDPRLVRETGRGRRDGTAAPVWECDERSRGSDYGPRKRPRRAYEEEKRPHAMQLPHMLSWFIGELPTPVLFDGTC